MNDRLDTLTSSQFQINERLSNLETDVLRLGIGLLLLCSAVYLLGKKTHAF